MDGSRHSVTLVTSLWGNGEVGPLTVVLPNGFLSDNEIAELRKSLDDNVYLMGSGRHSHFMTAETVSIYLENVLAAAFSKRRSALGQRYNRSFENEYGILLCDSFTGHHATSQGSDLQRHSAHIYIGLKIFWICILDYPQPPLNMHIKTF